MKKMIQLLSVCACFLYACQTTPSYEVSGTLRGSRDGDTVQLILMNGWDSTILQEMRIKNGQFEFSGRQDTAVIVYIYSKSKEAPAFIPFILENGNIKISNTYPGVIYRVKGTATNEVWSEYTNNIEQMCGESLDLFRTLNNDSTMTDDKREQLTKEMKEIEEKTKQYRFQFCKNNIGNLAGVVELVRNAQYFDPEKVAVLASEIPEICRIPEVLAFITELDNQRKTAIGLPFIDFSMKTADGKNIAVSELIREDKVTMIDFWASWCVPCIKEMPHVKAAYSKFKDRGFGVIGVSLDSNEKAWKNTIEKLTLLWPQLSDLKGWQCEAAELYGVKAIPATVLIQNGKIIDRNLRGEDIEKRLEELLQ